MVRLHRVWSPIVILSLCLWIVRKVVSFFAVWLMMMMIIVSLILLITIIFVLFIIRITTLRMPFRTFQWFWVLVFKATSWCCVLVSVRLVDSSKRLRIGVVLFLL